MTSPGHLDRGDGSPSGASPTPRTAALPQIPSASNPAADLPSRFSSWGWGVFLVAGVVVLGVYPSLSEAGRAVAYFAVGAVGVGAVVLVARRRSGRCARGWWLAGGLGAFVVADLVWSWFDWVVGQPPPFPSLADLLYLGGYPLIIAGYLTLFGFDHSRDVRNRWIDAAIVGIATLVAMGQVVVLPALASGQDLSLAEVVVSAIYPVADVLLLVAAVLALPLARRRDVSGWLLGAGALTMLLADVGYASEILGGAYSEAALLDVGWLATYVALGAAALRPPGGELRRVAGADTFQRPLVAVWTASVLVAVGTSAHQILAGPSDGTAVAIGASGVIVVFVLISLRVRRMVRRVLASESRSRAIVGALVDAVLTVDADGVVRAVDGNRALVGDDRLVGSAMGDLFPTPLSLPDRDATVVHVDGVTVEPAGGAAFTADVTWSRPDDDRGHWFVVVRDATDRHRAERELRLAGRRTATANEALRAANARLEQANVELSRTAQLKRDFLSLVSHELRTPLTPILGFSDLLLHRWDQLPDELRRTHLEAVQRHAQRLRGAVDNLLVIATDRHGRVRDRAAPTDVPAMLAAVVDELGVPVDVPTMDASLAVVVAPDELRLLLRNLIGNAAAHGAPPLRVVIAAEAEWLDIRVCDSGEGMPPRLLGEMFEPFTQGSVGDRRTVSGLGLGLAVARTLVELNGGSTRYEPQEPAGACFVVRLPRG